MIVQRAAVEVVVFFDKPMAMAMAMIGRNFSCLVKCGPTDYIKQRQKKEKRRDKRERKRRKREKRKEETVT